MPITQPFCKTAITQGGEDSERAPQLFLYSATKVTGVLKPVKSSLESQMTSQYILLCQHDTGARHWK